MNRLGLLLVIVVVALEQIEQVLKQGVVVVDVVGVGVDDRAIVKSLAVQVKAVQVAIVIGSEVANKVNERRAVVAIFVVACDVVVVDVGAKARATERAVEGRHERRQ